MKTEILETVHALLHSNIIDESTIPNIDLYVDQLTSFIENNSFSNTENHLTKSMVNNYCKNNVIPSSIKKKYSKSHILYLIIIYNTKSIITINEISKIFSSFEESEVLEYYNATINLMLDNNDKFYNDFSKDLDIILENPNLPNDKMAIAILATKLSIEANYKKILSEILIEKYLQ